MSCKYSGCSGITSLTIPKYVESIGGWAFSDCPNLFTVTIESNDFMSQDFEWAGWDENDVLINLRTIFGEQVKNYFLSNDLTRIGSNAFYGCSNLTSITIPESVTSIGYDAFKGCSGLTSITIPENVTSIGEYAFYGCSGITNITIPKYVETIGEKAFSSCPNLTSVTIKSNAFVSQEFGWIEHDYGWESHSELNNIGTIFGEQVKNYFLSNDLTRIGDNAFYGCSNLKSITIPESVTNIGYAAFSGCSGFTSITIPESVTSIGYEAFYGCSGITSITIPKYVESIGEYAFHDCPNLTTVTIESNAFVSQDFYLIDYDDGWESYSEIYNFGSIFGEQVKNYILSNDLTRIGDCAFYGCSNLTSFTIPEFVTRIGDYAFYECSGITSITIPENVTSIGEYAFYGCSGITSITIPKYVENIGEKAFSSCPNLTSVTIKSNAFVSQDFGWIDYDYGDSELNNFGTIFGKQVKSYILSDGLTRIGDNAFYECSGITSITIPESVTSIGEYAFYYCSGLTSITIPENVTNIGEWAFADCSGLTSISIPEGVTNIGDGTFSGCKSLTSINIPEVVTSIGEYAFSGCSSLASINIPNCVTGIGDGTFWGCSCLCSITIPESVTSIGEEAFYGCSSLASINIPESVTSIGGYAFNGCSSLTSIIIPQAVTSIGGYAFKSCNGLTFVTINATHLTDIGVDCFANVGKADNPCQLVVTDGFDFGNVNTTDGCFKWKGGYFILYSPVIITAKSYTIHYGDEIPIFEYSSEGDLLDGVPSLTCEATSTSPVGTYPIIVSRGGVSNPNLTFVQGTLTIERAPLIVTANSYTVFRGEDLPTFEATYSGFKNGEDESVLNTPPSFTCATTSTDIPGVYAITPGAADADNYEFSYVDGFLTVVELKNILSASMDVIRSGKNASFKLHLDNEDELIAFEFYMKLPEGITIALDDDGYPDAVLNSERSNRHVLEVADDGNGLFHFLCYSNRNYAFKGNSGELMVVNLACDKDVAPGTYQGLIQSIKFSDTSDELVLLPNVPFDINVTNVTMGDVNDDGDIDVMDLVGIVNKIMDFSSSNFITEAADHNKDGIIDVIDLVREVRLIMAQAVYAPSNSFDLLSNSLFLLTERDGAVTLNFNDVSNYVAAQFVVSISDGQRLENVTTDNKHIVSFEPVSDNQYVVVCYSNSNDTFVSNSATMTLHVEGNGTVSVEKTIFVRDDNEKVIFQNVNSEYTDGIHYEICNFNTPVDIYSISGILLRKNATSFEGLDNGVYVINGRKYIKR